MSHWAHNEHKVTLTDEPEEWTFDWIWVIVVNADKEVTSDRTSSSRQYLFFICLTACQRSMTRQDSGYLTEAMMKLSCDTELSTKLSSLEDFVVVSLFFVSVVITVHAGPLSSYRSRRLPLMVGGRGNCSVMLNHWGEVLSSGRMNLSDGPASDGPALSLSLSLLLLAPTALKVSALWCSTPHLCYFIGNKSRNKAAVTPDSIPDLILSSEKLFCLFLLQGSKTTTTTKNKIFLK